MGAGGLIPVAVMATLGQVTGLLGTAVQLVALYRQARDAWKAANPGETPVDADGNPIPLVEDAELINLLRQDAAVLVAAAQALIGGKYAPAPAPDGPAPGDGSAGTDG